MATPWDCGACSEWNEESRAPGFVVAWFIRHNCPINWATTLSKYKIRKGFTFYRVSRITSDKNPAKSPFRKGGLRGVWHSRNASELINSFVPNYKLSSWLFMLDIWYCSGFPGRVSGNRNVSPSNRNSPAVSWWIWPPGWPPEATRRQC